MGAIRVDDRNPVEDLLGTVLVPVEPADTPEAPSGDALDPAYVYVPTKPFDAAADPTRQHVLFELRTLKDGSSGLPVYTDRDRLVGELGEFQPHVRISVLHLLAQLSKVTIAVDPALSRGATRWTSEDLATWRPSAEGPDHG